MAGNHEVVPYIPFDPNQCTGGGGIIGGHVYDDYIHDLSIYKLKVYPGLTFVNVVVEWETDNYDFDVNNLNVSCYTHNYGVLEYGTPNYDNGTNGDFIYIKKQSENTPQYNAGQQMADIEGTEYMGNAFVDELGNTSLYYTPEIYSYSMQQVGNNYNYNNDYIRVRKLPSSDFSYALCAANSEWIILNNGLNDISGPDIKKFDIIEAKSVIPKE